MTDINVNHLFAEATTSAAFSLTLNGRMVETLAMVIKCADAGEPLKAQFDVRATQGLMRRGLIVASQDVGEWKPGQPFYVKYEPSMAGRLVHALTMQAGLIPGAPSDPLIDEMRRLQAIRAEAERIACLYQEQQHEDFVASIKPKLREKTEEPR